MLAADGIQYPLQRRKVGRLDEVVIEADLARALLVLRWRAPRQPAHTLVSGPPRATRNRSCRASDVQRDYVGPEPAHDGRRAVVGEVGWCPALCMSAAMLSAASG